MKKMIIVTMLIGVLFVLCGCSDTSVKSNNDPIIIKEKFIEEKFIEEKFIEETIIPEKIIVEKTFENSTTTWDDI